MDKSGTNQITIVVTSSTAKSLYYYCQLHAQQGGKITVIEAATGSAVRIEAESFVSKIQNDDNKPEAEDTNDEGGGQNLGWFDAGDWVEYDLPITVAGNYRIDYRVASQGGSSPGINIKINSDVRIFLKNLVSKKLVIKKNQFEKWRKKLIFLKSQYPVVEPKHYLKKDYVNPYAFFGELSKNIKKNSILIPDASANLIWCMQGFQRYKDTKVFTALNHSPMGYSLPASVGAALGSNKKIYAMIGDGSVPMNVQELETIQNYNLNVLIFVINNKGYGLIKQTQETWLKSNYAGVDKKSGLSLPDNCKIAKSYKIKNITLRNNNEVRTKISKILKTRGPLLIDVMIDPNSRVKPKIEYGKPLHDMYPYINRKEVNKIIK
mgnify:CR=1 FL=1